MTQPLTSEPEPSGGMNRTTFLIAGLVFMAVFVIGMMLENPFASPEAPQAFSEPVPTPASDVIEAQEPAKTAPVKAKPQPVGHPPRNCAEARRRGIAPMYEGDPNYGEWMDGDGDGIACEPYHGR